MSDDPISTGAGCIWTFLKWGFCVFVIFMFFQITGVVGEDTDSSGGVATFVSWGSLILGTFLYFFIESLGRKNL